MGEAVKVGNNGPMKFFGTGDRQIFKEAKSSNGRAIGGQIKKEKIRGNYSCKSPRTNP